MSGQVSGDEVVKVARFLKSPLFVTIARLSAVFCAVMLLGGSVVYLLMTTQTAAQVETIKTVTDDAVATVERIAISAKAATVENELFREDVRDSVTDISRRIDGLYTDIGNMKADLATVKVLLQKAASDTNVASHIRPNPPVTVAMEP